MGEPLCVVCSNQTVVRCRRRLNSVSSSPTLPLLRKVFSSLFGHDSANLALSDNAGRMGKYLCFECFNLLKRIQKTEDDLKQMNDNLAARIAKSGGKLGLRPLAHPAAQSTSKESSHLLCSTPSSSVSVSITCT